MGEKDKNKDKDWLDQRYVLKRKGFTLVMEELKQGIIAKVTKVKRYNNRAKQFHDNRNFQINQEDLFKILEGKEERTKPPNAEDAAAFSKGIWSTKVEHKQDAEWINKAKENMPSKKQNTVKITKDDVETKLKSMPDWNGSGPDKIHGFWLRSFKAVHEVQVTVLNECIEEGDVPGWLVEVRTVLMLKDSKKGTEMGNYRPLACLNMIWKLLTGIIIGETYDHSQKNNYYQKNKKEVEESTKGRKINLGYKDAYCKIAGKERMARKNMALVDCNKAYDMSPTHGS